MKHFKLRYAQTTLLALLVLLGMGSVVGVFGCHSKSTTTVALTDAGLEKTTERTVSISHPVRLGSGGGLPDGGGVAPNHVSGDDLLYFGSGADGPLSNDGGTFTLSRDYYFTNVSGTGTIVTANYKLYANGTCDTTTGLIFSNGIAGSGGAGVAGGNPSSSVGGSGGVPVPYGTLPQGTPGLVGGTGTIFAGDAGTPPVNAAANGGSSLGSGAGGAAISGAGGVSSGAGVAVPFPFYTWSSSPVIGFVQGGNNGVGLSGVSVVPIPFGGIGGGGGGGGGGTDVVVVGSGGGGGGGGAGAGTLWISCAIINRTNAGTAVGAFQSVGGNGGVGGGGCSSVGNGCGAGGGGAGGGGGPIYIYYGMLTGNTAFNAITNQGGLGANGGAANTLTGGASAGNGGGGGSSGSTLITNLTNQTQLFFSVVSGSPGGTGSGDAGGVGGASGQLTTSL